MEKPKEKIIWDLAQEVLNTHGDRIDSMDIIETDDFDEVHIKIYHGKGHCFELEKQVHFDPTEEKMSDYSDIHALQKDGCTYHFDEPWDGYTYVGIDKAIELLKEYANGTH